MFKKSTKFDCLGLIIGVHYQRISCQVQDNIRQNRKRHGQHFSRIQCINVKQIVLK